ncbi:hypothetical protein J2Z40_001697 [Cytobacillus eiseniae]|uniref:Uncharacterized protein n=1 Tax=Cytobacillus eiseniae TaxID=762947 RepID=A0ABS4RE08_9BACI|nr:DUF3813 family protein [Cytobacillus eiseniae]MBP2241135.1 hypothetical protein [Cytobacillus eiseniae]
MDNQLVQETRRIVDETRNVEPVEQQMRIIAAQNVISPAFASTAQAEQDQLSSVEKELDVIKHS